MSRRGRDRGGPSDDELLEALDRLVERQGIVEAGERLGVNYQHGRQVPRVRHVSRRMREALRKYVRQQGEPDGLGEQGEQGEQVGTGSARRGGGPPTGTPAGPAS